MSTITMTRVTNGNADERIRVEIKDETGKRLFNAYMTLENYARAVTGRSEVPFDDKH